MTTTNKYTDTTSIDYLEAIKRNQLEFRNSKSSVSNFDMTYMFNPDNEITFTNSFTNTEKSIGDYDVVDNSSKLVAYIPMDYDTLDASNSNDGTVTGTETYVAGPEISSTHPFRKAFSFNGSSYISLANESNFDFEHSNPFSVSFWINGASQSLKIVIGKGSLGTAGYTFFTNSGTHVFRLTDSSLGTFQVVTASTTQNSKWHHLVGTFSGNSNRSGLKIYVDGVLDNTGTAGAISNSILNNIAVQIGAGNALSHFTGSVDEVQIWNVELSSTDVTDLYAGKQINKDTPAKPAYLGASDVA